MYVFFFNFNSIKGCVYYTPVCTDMVFKSKYMNVGFPKDNPVRKPWHQNVFLDFQQTKFPIFRSTLYLPATS